MVGPIKSKNNIGDEGLHSSKSEPPPLSRKASNSFAKVGLKKIKQKFDVGMTKKVLSVSQKSIYALNVYTGKVRCYNFTAGLGQAQNILNFYSTGKNLITWVEYFSAPFSKETLDKEKAKKTLKNALIAKKLFLDPKSSKEFANKIVKDLTENEVSNFSNPIEGRTELQRILMNEFVLSADDTTKNLLFKKEEALSIAESISNKVVFRQKSYSVPLCLALVCFTTTSLASDLLTLESWNVISLNAFTSKCAKVASVIGTKFPLLTFLNKITVTTFLKSFTMTGMGLMLLVKGYEGVTALFVYFDKDSTPEEVAQALKKMQSASVGVIVNVVGLTCIIAPMCFTFPPLVIAVLPIVSQGTGFIGALIT